MKLVLVAVLLCIACELPQHAIRSVVVIEMADGRVVTLDDDCTVWTYERSYIVRCRTETVRLPFTAVKKLTEKLVEYRRG